ncbi:MAG: hypothetical protein M3373_05675 [Gemmatimonadota bacterium]|nr:hypothetical protein [Gemmatimonadota bacterium]
MEDQYGNGVYREQVQFAATAGDGYTERMTLTTDTLGVTSTRWIPGSIGANAATATWNAQSATFIATGTAGAGLSILIVSGNEQTLVANALVPIGPPLPLPLVVTAGDNLSAVPFYTGPTTARAGTRLPVPRCIFRTGPAFSCSGSVSGPNRQGPGGTLIAAPGYYPPNEAAYYWILPSQPGTYYFWANAGSNSNYLAVTATR